MGNPFYRGLMGLLSPSLLVKSTAKRWSSFHQGATMTEAKISSTHGHTEARIFLNNPPGLFTTLMLRQHCSTFLTMFALCHAKNARVVYEKPTPESTAFIATWDE